LRKFVDAKLLITVLVVTWEVWKKMSVKRQGNTGETVGRFGDVEMR
jgi:hypothetical protein